jgi:hypothetical protein
VPANKSCGISSLGPGRNAPMGVRVATPSWLIGTQPRTQYTGQAHDSLTGAMYLLFPRQLPSGCLRTMLCKGSVRSEHGHHHIHAHNPSSTPLWLSSIWPNIPLPCPSSGDVAHSTSYGCQSETAREPPTRSTEVKGTRLFSAIDQTLLGVDASSLFVQRWHPLAWLLLSPHYPPPPRDAVTHDSYASP